MKSGHKTKSSKSLSKSLKKVKSLKTIQEGCCVYRFLRSTGSMLDRVMGGSAARQSTKHQGVATDDEKKAKAERENQQLLIYLFVCVMLVSAWLLGMYGASFFWVFALITLTFVVWWNKAMGLLDKHLRQQELLLHRRRALRQSETTEWINFLINRWWVFSSAGISDLVKRHLDPLLQDIRPPYLESIELKTFTLGDKTPFIKYVHVHEYTDGGKRPLSFTSVAAPPSGLSRLQTYQLVVEADVGLLCEDFKMIFSTRLGGKRMGMNMDLAVERLNISGKLQLVVHLDMNTAFPHVSFVTASFTEKPEVLFAVRVLSLVQIMEIPLLKAWLQQVVEDGFTHALVDPGRIDFKLETYGPTNVPDKNKQNCKAQGVLTVVISGENLKGSVFVDDTRYCQLRLGDQKQHTKHRQAPSQFTDTCSFLVYSLKDDKLIIKSKTKILLSTQALAQFEISLSEHPLEHRQSVDVQLEQRISKTKLNGATIKLSVTLKYTKLSSVQSIMKKLNSVSTKSPPAKLPSPTEGLDPAIDCGVLYICIHNAIGLLGLDRNGFSDPYCITYINGKKLNTTHYISRSKNPKWEVTTEMIIGDFSKSMLSFVVYDWDGTSMSEDDFLGSAHMVLSKDEPTVIQKSLTLGYNLLNVGQVENNKLGSITVSVIFRPVPNVATANSDDDLEKKPASFETPNTGGKSFMYQASEEPQEDESKKASKRNSAIKELLSTGQGLLEINLHQAKDLVAADSNGFSDPYCEVRLNNERKFVTNVKKKTLNPFWDEWVTLPLPKQSETLELIVWDKDAFFQKDFLGAVTFTLDDLKRYSTNSQHAGWFELQRARTGWIEAHFKIISDDVSDQDVDGVTMIPEFNQSPSADSGIYNDKNQVDVEVVRNASTGSNMSRKSSRSNRSSKLQAAKSHTLQVMPDTSQPMEQTLQVQVPNSPLSPISSMDAANNNTPKTPTPTATPPQLPAYQHPDTPPSPAAAHDSHIGVPSTKSPTTTQRKHNIKSMMNIGSNNPEENGHNLSRSSSTTSLAPEEKLHWVQGNLGQIRGLDTPSGHIYCKLRLDNRSLAQRTKKFSQGQVISKTPNISTASTGVSFNHSFQIDHGYGVAKEALLIFDVKTSHKEHLATKGYLLQDLLHGENDVMTWIPIENGVEIQVTISRDSLASPLPKPDRNKLGFFSSFRKPKSKVKEQ